jgi:acetyltransferase-like isoleucine patch superfamily enzyme
MSKTYILGNGGFSQEVFAQIIVPNNYDFGGFIIVKDDKALLIDEEGINPFSYPKNAMFILGTGNKKWRRIFISHFLKYYDHSINHFPNVFAKSVFIASTSKMGIGNIFCEFSLLNATADIGDFNSFNIYSTASHDCSVGDNNVFSPYSSVMGYCEIGNENFLGVNTHITPKVKLGDENTLSAGEVLFDDMSNRQFFQSGIITDKP